jgi:Rrf2 family protein
MRISTKGRYALRTLADIASQRTSNPVSFQSIAQRQGISQKYLWQIITPLKEAGILDVIRGVNGGCVLTRDPQTLTVRDILVAAEGPIMLVPCLNDHPDCARAASCCARSVWNRVNQKLLAALDEITLSTVMEEQAIP